MSYTGSSQSSHDRYNLQQGATVVLDADGNGRISLGPSASAGPATWHVTGVIVQTNRPGKAPVPRVQVWLDQDSAQGAQGLTYDGSFSQGRCDLTITRGQVVIVQWTGGQAGDIASCTVTGERW